MPYTPGGLQAVPSTLTRPADTTAYTQYDLIASLTSSAIAAEIQNTVRFGKEGFRWEGARLYSTNASAKTKTFRLHLFDSQPTLSANDNDAFNASGAQTLAVADVYGYVGYLDITLSEAGTAGATGRAGLDYIRTIAPAGTSLYWVLEVRDAAGYTPISGEVFTLNLEGQWS